MHVTHTVCSGIPTQTIANSDGWPASCQNTPLGGECAVTCSVGYTASQPKSVCRAGATPSSPGVWATASPSTCVQCEWHAKVSWTACLQRACVGGLPMHSTNSEKPPACCAVRPRLNPLRCQLCAPHALTRKHVPCDCYKCLGLQCQPTAQTSLQPRSQTAAGPVAPASQLAPTALRHAPRVTLVLPQ